MSKITDNQIRDLYINFFVERFVYSTASLEDMSDDLYQRLLKINILKAYKDLIQKEAPLNIGDIKQVGDSIQSTDIMRINCYENDHNTNSNANLASTDQDIIKIGFRKIDVDPGAKANFTPADPEQIHNLLNNLLINYNYVWQGLDPFEKEAQFHIKFMRIHPFEDGNKRSGKIIMATNFFKMAIIPPIITKDDTDEYYDFINNQDYENFAKFLRQKSNLENDILCGYYKSLKDIDPTENVDGDDIKRKIFKK